MSYASYFTECPFSIDSYDGFYVDMWYNIRSRPETVFKNECDNFQTQNYFLLPNGMSNAGFVLDRNCYKPFNKVLVRNTNNGQVHMRLGLPAKIKTGLLYPHGMIFCRGTERFQIQIKSDLGNWVTVLENELENADFLGCNVPVYTFHLENPQTSRLVRFLVKSMHGGGAGLQYLGLEYDANITTSAGENAVLL